MSIRIRSKKGTKGSIALKRSVKKYSQEIDKEMVLRVTQASIFVEGEAKRNIGRIKSEQDKLVDTGRMLNSITHVVERAGKKVKGFVGTNVFYAKFQELGTRFIPPRPFIRPAITENIKRITSIIAKGLNQAAKKVDKK